uniref:Uncharacterized protein n=1 Tax=Salix viminalis TaxID=40686 RepID=A0A6N2KDL3_SALVM
MKLERKFKESGFGFSPVTNQFKVTRMISQCAHDAHTDLGLKHFKFHGVKSKFEVIVHTPSFISPKDALLGDDMQLRQTCLRQPSINMKLERKFKEYGFGFSPVTNQFEVIRMISQCAHDAHTDLGLKHFKFHGVKSKFEVIVHTPSFISPKDALLGDDMQVLNINSRCAELKLQHVQSSFFGGTETWRLSPKVQVKGVENGKSTGGRSGGDAV